MAAIPPWSRRGSAAAWEAATVSAKRVDQSGVGKPGRGGDAVELGLGREAAHLEQPLDGLAGAVQRETADRLAR